VKEVFTDIDIWILEGSKSISEVKKTEFGNKMQTIINKVIHQYNIFDFDKLSGSKLNPILLDLTLYESNELSHLAFKILVNRFIKWRILLEQSQKLQIFEASTSEID